MGKVAQMDARTQARDRIALPAADFWELRSRMAEVQIAREAVRQSVAAAREAEAKLNALYARLAKDHGLERDVAYDVDEAACALVRVPEPGRGKTQ